jgi:hypothetical protein
MRKRKPAVLQVFTDLANAVDESARFLAMKAKTQGENAARADHRRAVLQLGAACPPNIAECLAWLHAANRVACKLRGEQIGARKSVEMTATLNTQRNLVSAFVVPVAGATKDSLIDASGGSKNTAATSRRKAKRIVDLLGSKVQLKEYCPPAAKSETKNFDVVQFAKDCALGRVPLRTNTRAAKEAIAAGVFTLKQIRIAQMATRMATQPAHYDKMSKRREDRIAKLRASRPDSHAPRRNTLSAAVVKESTHAAH